MAAVAARLGDLGFAVERLVVRRRPGRLELALRDGAARHALVVTTGGTGLTPRDVTPQATRAVIDYEVPGLAEAMRAVGRAEHADGRPVARRRRASSAGALIVNLPGSPKGALESLDAIAAVLDHALETLAGPYDHGTGPAWLARSGGVATLMFEVFAEVPAYPLVFPVFWGAAIVLRPGHGPPPAGLRGRPVRQPGRSPTSRHGSSGWSSTPSSRPRCSRTRAPR